MSTPTTATAPPAMAMPWKASVGGMGRASEREQQGGGVSGLGDRSSSGAARSGGGRTFLEAIVDQLVERLGLHVGRLLAQE